MKQSDDEQHLQLLSIFHYVVAGFAALFACFPIFHFIIGIGLFIIGVTQSQQTEAFPLALVGLILAVVGGSIMLFGWAFAICIALAGRFLSQKKHRMFCFVMAGIECTSVPFGTILGVFTIIVLARPSVRELFMPQNPAAPASQAA
jgi:lysylphosphatidylglycerol synthetase-like protein (DUF2156 family)